MSHRSPLIVLALSVALLLPGHGLQARPRAAKKVRVAVLPVKLKGVGGKTGRTLGKAMFRELGKLGVFRFISPRLVAKRLRLLKRKRVFSGHCADSAKCLSRLGRSLKAAVIYSLQVEKQDSGMAVVVRTFDGRSGRAIRRHQEKAAGQQAEIQRAVRWAVRLASGPMLTTLRRGKGKLRVESSVAEAQLLLNGKNFGQRTGKTFKVGAGVFDVQVRREGYRTFRDVVVVKPNQQVVVAAKLERSEEVPDVTDSGMAEAPAPAAAAVPPPVAPPVEKPAPSTTPQPTTDKKKKDLPAWAIFEKPQAKPKPLILSQQGRAAGSQPADTAAATGFASSEQVPPPPPRRERRFYQTWWFWTIVGAVVAGGGGTAAYFLTRGGSEGPAGTGTALVGWQ